jgi:hypothetical protein
MGKSARPLSLPFLAGGAAVVLTLTLSACGDHDGEPSSEDSPSVDATSTFDVVMAADASHLDAAPDTVASSDATLTADGSHLEAAADTGGALDATTITDGDALEAGVDAAEGAIDAAVANDATGDAVADAPGAGVDASDAASGPLFDAASATFTAVYQTILAGICAQCHAQNPPRDSNLYMPDQATAYANLVGVPAAGSACAGFTSADGGVLLRVAPGDSAHSLLYQKVSETQPCGSPMPLENDSLDATQIALIQAWIDFGAPND